MHVVAAAAETRTTAASNAQPKARLATAAQVSMVVRAEEESRTEVEARTEVEM